MNRTLRPLALALVLALAVPASLPAVARASALPTETELRLPKSFVEWLRKNGPTLYVIFDEIMDDVFGCGCPPPPPTAPEDDLPPTQP